MIGLEGGVCAIPLPRKAEATARRAGVRSAPMSSLWADGNTRRENRGADALRTAIILSGRVSIGDLSWPKEHFYALRCLLCSSVLKKLRTYYVRILSKASDLPCGRRGMTQGLIWGRIRERGATCFVSRGLRRAPGLIPARFADASRPRHAPAYDRDREFCCSSRQPSPLHVRCFPDASTKGELL